jgi:hypothetical protein
VLISHSQSGIDPFQVVAGGAEGVAAIVADEPTACPTDDVNSKAHSRIPILLLYGDFIADSPSWSAHYKACKAFAAAVNAAGESR